MTHPTGRTFLSYRRARADEAMRVIQALHDHGIPTWQDVTNLASAPTEDELRRMLADSSIGSAVIYATPEVETSTVIRNVEIPSIIKRAEAWDGFFVVPVAAGGLSYSDAARVTSTHLSAQNFTDWNMLRVAALTLSPDDAAAIADRVLAQRVAAVHEKLPTGPLKLGLFVRVPPPFDPDVALALSWSKRFDGRIATAETWNTTLLPALARVAQAVRQHASGREIEAFGFPTLPAAFALGAAFIGTGGLKLAWRQIAPGHPDQIWTLGAERVESGFVARTFSKDAGARDVAVLISVADNVEPAFTALQRELLPLRAVVRVEKPGGLRHRLSSPSEAADVAHVVEEAMRNLRSSYGNIGTVHVVAAVPAGLAVLIGQTFNTFGTVQTYELVGNDGSGRYVPAALLHPSR